MKRNEHKIGSREQKFRCPVCEARIHRDVGSPQRGPLVSEAGQLTQCDRCLSMLEYVSHESSLALRLASQRRINELNQLTKDNHEFRLTELIDYVKKYRRMPVTPGRR
jgi:hypothetical protein